MGPFPAAGASIRPLPHLPPFLARAMSRHTLDFFLPLVHDASVASAQPLRFHHLPVRVNGHLLIKSECVRCGQSRVVSAADGSLEAWETTHRCNEIRSAPIR
jgi:hypothetical protein